MSKSIVQERHLQLLAEWMSRGFTLREALEETAKVWPVLKEVRFDTVKKRHEKRQRDIKAGKYVIKSEKNLPITNPKNLTPSEMVEWIRIENYYRLMAATQDTDTNTEYLKMAKFTVDTLVAQAKLSSVLGEDEEETAAKRLLEFIQSGKSENASTEPN